MDFEVDRRDLHHCRVMTDASRELEAGQARLRIERFGLTSNNITYAAFGDMLQYWNFFPPAAGGEPGQWGRVPVWGFAEVVDTNTSEVEVGRRVFGYFPMSDQLVVQPGRGDEFGFSDLAPHRQAMASAYNRYVYVDADPMYDSAREVQQMVLWPLFMTSFLIDDYLDDNNRFGANIVVVSSASSKTAIGAAHLLALRAGVRVVGLTSSSNVAFVESLGCYHDVITYDGLDALPDGDAVYVDIAGNGDVRAAVHRRYDSKLRASMIVGSTHWDHEATGVADLSGPKPEFFFAPNQIAKRSKEWGKAALDERVGAAWRTYAQWSGEWLRFEEHFGSEGVETAYRQLLSGSIDPAVGYVVQP